MSYTRVIPRDLFNEAKLLKCLGQLALLITDGLGVPRGLTLDHDIFGDRAGFQIEQDQTDGSIYCANMELNYQGRLIGLRSPLNSRDAFPLQFIRGDESGSVFDDKGKLSHDFVSMLKNI